MSDLEFNYDSDQEVSENHSKLINAVRQLDKGQRVKKPERNEPSLEVSEFHLVKSSITDRDPVAIEDLAKTLGKKIKVKKDKTKVLKKPLEKPAAERIKRKVGFENTKKELGKWAGIVARNRTAASISFPLSHGSVKLAGTDDYLKRSRLQSDLEKKLAELEPEKEPEKEKDEFPLTLKEIQERRKEAAKFRAQQSYKEAKAHRQNKIKSKKYHRIQRKERIKKALKEFEELQKTDPQAALEKLEQLDRARAQERMTLRHKSTGQWAKNKQIRAKYDKESRQVLAEQLSISRELTQKVKKDEDSEEEDDNLDQPVLLTSTDKENPWMNPVKNQSEIEEFISGYRKYWDERNKQSQSINSTDENNVNVKQNKKVFEEPAINNVSESLNPVKEVIEEHLSHFQKDFSEDNNSDASKSEDEIFGEKDKKQKRKLKKTLKNKLVIKSPKSKVVKKSKIKVGTSNWSVSPVNTITGSKPNGKDIDIDEMFDSVEDKIQEKINKKLSKVKKMLDQETKKEKKKGKKKMKDDSISDVDKLGLKGQKNMRPIIDKSIEETALPQVSNENIEIEKITNITDFNNIVTSKSKVTEIDPNKFMNMKPKHVNTLLPDEVGGEDDALDDEEVEKDQHQIISEAFADDDVVDEFRKEKEKEIKNSQPEDIDMRLPGWGSWGGKDIKQSTRKKRRFIMRFPKEAPRRDENKGDVVIIEEKCPKIKKHLVSDLPFPFTTVQDFEASIRAPVSREFVPEKSFSKLIQPALKTKMGKIIEPMSEDILVKTGNIKKRKKPEKKDVETDKQKKQKTNPKSNKNFKKGQKKGQ